MRGTQLARQWKILRLLEARRMGLAAEELSSDLDVPVRTIYRDLEAIQGAGFPIYTERIERRSLWKLMDGFKAGFPLPLTTTELMSLHMSREILKIFDGTVFQESVESLFDKVRSCLPQETIWYLERFSGSIKVGFGHPKKLQEIKQIISEISDAAAKRKQVEILYPGRVNREGNDAQGTSLPSLGHERELLPNRFLSQVRKALESRPLLPLMQNRSQYKTLIYLL